jgi:hypothetical protein
VEKLLVHVVLKQEWFLEDLCKFGEYVVQFVEVDFQNPTILLVLSLLSKLMFSFEPNSPCF